MDSNHRPTDYESAALTAVLRALIFHVTASNEFSRTALAPAAKVGQPPPLHLTLVLYADLYQRRLCALQPFF